MFDLFTARDATRQLIAAALTAIVISPYGYAPGGMYAAPWWEPSWSRASPSVPSFRKKKRRLLAAKQKRKKRVRPNKRYQRSLR